MNQDDLKHQSNQQSTGNSPAEKNTVSATTEDKYRKQIQ
jgi:hypothetical protein